MCSSEAQVIEIQGDVKGALKQAGFGYFTQINRTREGDTSFFFVEGRRERAQVESGSPRYPQEESRYDCSVQLPYEDRHGAIGKSHTQHGSQQNAVFVRTGEKTFELREFVAERLGVTLQFTPKPEADEPNVLRISPLIASTTTVDARETTPGVDLEIGKPIVATRKLETSLRLVDGPNSTPVIVPGPEGRQLVLFVTAQRVHKPRPGEVLPSPLPGR